MVEGTRGVLRSFGSRDACEAELPYPEFSKFGYKLYPASKVFFAETSERNN